MAHPSLSWVDSKRTYLLMGDQRETFEYTAIHEGIKEVALVPVGPDHDRFTRLIEAAPDLLALAEMIAAYPGDDTSPIGQKATLAREIIARMHGKEG